MRKEIVKQWEANKHLLEEWFKTTKQSEYDEYKTIVTKVCELVLTDKKYKLDEITEIDNGDYQGTLLYAIPEDTYQPAEYEYLFTTVSYGSCSGCDTLQGISEYSDGLPTEEQVKEYMTLALHLVQHMKKYSEDFE